VYFGKMADSIKMPFVVVGRVGPSNDVLDGGRPFPQEGAIFVGEME